MRLRCYLSLFPLENVGSYLIAIEYLFLLKWWLLRELFFFGLNPWAVLIMVGRDVAERLYFCEISFASGYKAQIVIFSAIASQGLLAFHFIEACS